MMNACTLPLRGLIGLLLLSLFFSGPVSAERIKDLASIAGVRSNQLVGYGLVVGLNGTGDQTTQVPFTLQSIKNMLERQGISPQGPGNVQLKNVAAVMVTAELPPFSKPGQKVDITVSSIGNAKSLRGGTLLLTPLKGVDGNIYAIAQGNLIVGGLDASGKDGSRITINQPNAGRIPDGAIVERAVPSMMGDEGSIYLNLHAADFTTAKRMADAINAKFGGGVAETVDAVTVRVAAPAEPQQRVGYLAVLENVDVDPDAAPARVIVNSRSGTIVIGDNVRIMPAAVAHGNLTVTIKEKTDVSQPNPLSQGQTAVTPDSQVGVKQDPARMFLFEPGVTLNEIVQAINAVGAAPGDLVAILEALKSAGALRAELIVI
ncbi:MAG: flagellar basal body P-ring protein FlgI [Halothiobacillaceae bacterium]|jgi:flagellar P-ring protein precursor FlgI|nr:flagellar basal body P-ring protein FlgI [Halothiobacillaceae bacterium]MDY0050242.1 flagellar basal body P-ring protein FlgI [Halothiobacillaceae bacterium]